MNNQNTELHELKSMGFALTDEYKFFLDAIVFRAISFPSKSDCSFFLSKKLSEKVSVLIDLQATNKDICIHYESSHTLFSVSLGKALPLDRMISIINFIFDNSNFFGSYMDSVITRKCNNLYLEGDGSLFPEDGDYSISTRNMPFVSFKIASKKLYHV